LIAVGAIGLREGSWGVPVLTSGLSGLLIVGAAAVLCRFMVLSGLTAREDRRSPTPLPPAAATSAAESSSIAAIEARLSQLTDVLLLSESARSAIYGDREESAIRAVFAGHLRRGDYDRAESFCDAIEAQLRRDDLARELREEINSIRHHAVQSELEDAIATFDSHLDQRNWGGAFAEAARIRERFPGTELIRDLEQRALAAREQHKAELRARFTDAAERDRIDEALSLMKELDRYLSREEGEQFAPLAQRVITRHRERLSGEFRQAVQERRWADASRTGEVIIRDYPNTKMADEVRSMIDLIRTRATQAALAAGANR